MKLLRNVCKANHTQSPIHQINIAKSTHIKLSAVIIQIHQTEILVVLIIIAYISSFHSQVHIHH